MQDHEVPGEWDLQSVVEKRMKVKNIFQSTFIAETGGGALTHKLEPTGLLIFPPYIYRNRTRIRNYNSIDATSAAPPIPGPGPRPPLRDGDEFGPLPGQEGTVVPLQPRQQQERGLLWQAQEGRPSSPPRVLRRKAASGVQPRQWQEINYIVKFRV